MLRIVVLAFGTQADIDTEGGGGAQTHAAGAVVESAAAQGGDADIGNDGHALGKMDREHQADTAGERSLVDVGIAGMEIRDETVTGLEEHIAVEVKVLIFSEVGILIGGGDTPESGAETQILEEPVPGIGVNRRTGTGVRHLTALEFFSVKPYIESQTAADKPRILVEGTFSIGRIRRLSSGRKSGGKQQ